MIEQENFMNPICTHLNLIHKVTLSAEGCEECLALGETWVHLRKLARCQLDK